MRATAEQPQRAPDGTPVHYERHLPEQTTLYRFVQQHAASFIAHTETSTGAQLLQFIKDEFEAFLECDILAHGFLLLRCCGWGHHKLLAFSRKRQGFCPLCGARRRSRTAAHLVDHVIPHVPVRQFVAWAAGLAGAFEIRMRGAVGASARCWYGHCAASLAAELARDRFGTSEPGFYARRGSEWREQVAPEFCFPCVDRPVDRACTRPYTRRQPRRGSAPRGWGRPTIRAAQLITARVAATAGVGPTKASRESTAASTECHATAAPQHPEQTGPDGGHVPQARPADARLSRQTAGVPGPWTPGRLRPEPSSPARGRWRRPVLFGTPCGRWRSHRCFRW